MPKDKDAIEEIEPEWMMRLECFTMARDGFHGYLHRPEHNEYPGKVVIVVGGSEGSGKIPLNLGHLFAEHGITALGLCFWNAPGLPDDLVEVPLEPIERAVTYLLSAGFDKVAMYGISKGGELTLLASSLISAITCAIAVSPLCNVMCGIVGNKGMMGKSPSPKSSWAWGGKPVAPFVSGFKMNKAAIVRRLITEQQLDLCWAYGRALTTAPPASQIAVENINGPVLLISPTEDCMWPSASACKAAEGRLKEHDHPFPVKRLEYRYASHIIVPLATKQLRVFKVERKHPEECAASRADAFKQTLSFLREW